MNEHKGPWRHNNGEICVQRHGGVYVIGAFDAFGAFVEHSNQREFPEGFIPLVPQTEVDAELQDLGRLVVGVAEARNYSSEICGVKISPCDTYGRTNADLEAEGLKTRVGKLEDELAEAKAEAGRSEARYRTQKTKARRLRQRMRLHGLPTAIADNDFDAPAPSLPAVDFKDTEESLPQKLRAAAYLIDMQFDRLRCGDRPVASILYDEADRVEREQAGKAKRDKVIDAVAVAVCNISSWGQGRTTADEVAAALLDDPRFDITLKAVES